MDALGHKRRKPSGCLTFVILALGLPLIFFLGSDQLCRFDIDRRLLTYPDATLVTAEHNGIRLRAMGKTQLTYTTPDDYETVAQWFRELHLEQLDKGIFSGLAGIIRWTEKDPNGDGTLIYYVTECGL
jgi:hypothetical protein